MPKTKVKKQQVVPSKRDPIISNDDKLVQDLIKSTLKHMKKHKFTNEQFSTFKYGITKQVNKCSYVGSVVDE